MSIEWQEMARIGKKAVSAGLTSSRFGNISMLRRNTNTILITCTGSMLDELDESQVVEVDLAGPCPLDKTASSETCVHRAIYQCTSARAIIHTHSPYAVALSIIERSSLEPIDSEGKNFVGAIPIVDGTFGSSDLAKNVSSALRGHAACIARGHGVFAAGRSLTEAYTVACMAEHSSQVRYLVQNYVPQRSTGQMGQ